MIERAEKERVIGALYEQLSAWLKDERVSFFTTGDVDPEVFHHVVRYNRLEPLMAVVSAGCISSSGWVDAFDQFSHSYKVNLVRALRQTAAIQPFIDRLEGEGIRCIAMRGPYAGADLYGDIGARYFTDLDLFIEKEHRGKAWEIAHEEGFRMPSDSRPKGFYARHHLHWALSQPASGVFCDLHWALDHPYRPYRIAYQSIFDRSVILDEESMRVRHPCPEHKLVMSCIHLVKHCREYAQVLTRSDVAVDLAKRGWILHWLDVALMVKKYEGLDWGEVTEIAQRWGVHDALMGGLVGVKKLFDVSPPDKVCIQLPAHKKLVHRRIKWFDRMAVRGGFRPVSLGEVTALVFPATSYFSPRKGVSLFVARAKYCMATGMKLGLAGFESFYGSLKGRRCE